MHQPAEKYPIFEADYQCELWEKEYSILNVIPSSARILPSKALLLFSEILDYKSMQKVLDAGCGIGRNSIYLAQKGCEVHALDFSETALAKLHKAAINAGVRDKIFSYNYSLADPFPFEDGSFNLVLDSYVFCHFDDDHIKQGYRKELHRVTKPGGIVFSSVFSIEDSYYAPMIKNDKAEKRNIIIDPNNGIKKQLYTEKEIKDFFLVDFKLLYFVKFEFDDVVLGQPYQRSILVSILRK